MTAVDGRVVRSSGLQGDFRSATKAAKRRAGRIYGSVPVADLRQAPSRFKDDHPACVASLRQVVEGLRRLIDGVAAGDELVQLEASGLV